MVVLVLRGATTTADTTFTINSNDCLGGAVVVTDDNEEACARHNCTDQDFIDQDCINNDHHTLLKNIHQQLSIDKVGLSNTNNQAEGLCRCCSNYTPSSSLGACVFHFHSHHHHHNR